ncbi:hypothetical protein NQ314_018412 [Rhamnusium bicolor]|uniref:Uncharacterized protein n=1 Tax=Rhamnusium bicolor TaxID=1586634 RepID=A0AAV8WQA8_9CUCU|nr:hypothetical protein NQ314_018412 [Rhamnusium bicolor]
MSSTEIKNVIGLLCKQLNLLHNTNIKPEHFRLAKFDMNEDNVLNNTLNVNTLDKLSLNEVVALSDKKYCKEFLEKSSFIMNLLDCYQQWTRKEKNILEMDGHGAC